MPSFPFVLNLLADAATQAAEPDASGLWEKLADAVQGNLFTEAIVLTFATLAIVLYYIKEKYESLQASKETVVAYRVAQHQRKERTMRQFTDGIPTNLSIIFEIFTKRSYLRRMARVKHEDREPYLDGRSYKQISLAYERDMRLWLLKVQHFTSICTLVQARFDEPEIHRSAEQIRELFEMLIDLTPALPAIADVSERLTKLIDGCPSLSANLADVEEARRIVLQQMQAGASDGPKFDRTQCMRMARVIALGIDKLFVACTKMMSAELRHEPVKGLLDDMTVEKALRRKQSDAAKAMPARSAGGSPAASAAHAPSADLRPSATEPRLG